jgi:aminoglycoside 3-N-acetyltransferase
MQGAASAGRDVSLRQASDFVVTEADIAAALVEMGLAGRTLMVHSSLRAFGQVRGGAEAVLRALGTVAGAQGNLVFPSFAWCADEAATGEGLPLEGVPLEGEAEAFDPAATPAATGRISDLFWRQPGVRRSAHPTHALAARGPEADWILERHPAHRCCAWDGPYGRMTRLGGWVLLLGVGIESLTYLHALEDRAAAPYLQRAIGYLRRPRGGAAGAQTWAIPQVHYPSGDRDFYHADSRWRAWVAAWPPPERRTQRVGAAVVTALSMEALSRRVGAAMERDPLALLCRRPECRFCSAWRARLG